MKEQDLVKILDDFAKRIEYVRENMKKEDKGAQKHLKSLFMAKDSLLAVVENNVSSILGSFQAIEVLDELIKKENKNDERLSAKEISKYEKD